MLGRRYPKTGCYGWMVSMILGCDYDCVWDRMGDILSLMKTMDFALLPPSGSEM